MRISLPAVALVSALASIAPALGAAPAPRATSSPQRIAASALGSLLPYRSIAADTLTMVDKGDIPAARARIKDLETRWDADEIALKPKDRAAWTTVDRSIDSVLATLRSPMPKQGDCAAALRALIDRLDQVSQA